MDFSNYNNIVFITIPDLPDIKLETGINPSLKRLMTTPNYCNYYINNKPINYIMKEISSNSICALSNYLLLNCIPDIYNHFGLSMQPHLITNYTTSVTNTNSVNSIIKGMINKLNIKNTCYIVNYVDYNSKDIKNSILLNTDKQKYETHFGNINNAIEIYFDKIIYPNGVIENSEYITEYPFNYEDIYSIALQVHILLKEQNKMKDLDLNTFIDKYRNTKQKIKELKKKQYIGFDELKEKYIKLKLEYEKLKQLELELYNSTEITNISGINKIGQITIQKNKLNTEYKPIKNQFLSIVDEQENIIKELSIYEPIIIEYKEKINLILDEPIINDYKEEIINEPIDETF